MRKVRGLLRQLIKVFIFLIITVIVVYIIKWGRGFKIDNNFAESGARASAYPPPSTQISKSFSATSYPGPFDTQGTKSIPTIQATLVPAPPPGWPTNEPWPPDASKRTPYPTDNYPIFPTPDRSSLYNFDQLPSTITIWFPYFDKADAAPKLKEAKVDVANKVVELTPLNIELKIPTPITGPDPGPILVDLHLSPDSRWLVADFAYSGSQLIDLKSGKSRELAINLQSPYWKFVSWVSSSPVKLLAFGSEVPIRNGQLINLDTAEVEQAALLQKNAIEDGDLAEIAYSPDGTNQAIAVVKPPTAGIRKNWVAEVCLQYCKTRKIAEIEGGASFVDGSLQWSPNSRNLIWTVVVMGDGGKLEAQSWIYNIDTDAAKLLDVLGSSVKYIDPPIWSPDGSKIAVLKTILNSDGSKEIQNIFLIDVIKGEESRLTDFPNDQLSHLQWLPDGNWLAFTVTKGDYGEIWITNLDGKITSPFAGPTFPNAPYIITK
jgi:hypothetical protein